MSGRRDGKMGLGRRRFLHTAGMAAAGLPFLSALSSRAEPLAAPRRFVLWFTPNGTYWPEWFPTGGETDFRLGRILEPLEPFREHLTIFGSADEPSGNVREHVGISIKSAAELPSGGHGVCELVSGRERMQVDGEDWPSGPSIDQVIANRIGAETRFRSLELGVRVQGRAGSGKHVSYREAALPSPAEKDALAAFQRIFGDVLADPDAGARALARRTRLTDYLHGRFAALRPGLGADDRRMLDAHTEALHEVEGRLLSSAGAACTLPVAGDVPPDPQWDDYSNMPQIMRQQLDNLSMAFACDLTRVGTIQVTEAASNARYHFLDGPDGSPIEDWHHALSHEPIDDTVAMEKLTRIGRWHSEQLAYFLGRLAEIPDAGGSTVLDNTVVLWVQELSDGRFHTHQRMPFLMAGKAGGAVRSGRYLKVADEPHNNLLLSCVRAMGIDDETFGDPAACTGTIPGLLA